MIIVIECALKVPFPGDAKNNNEFGSLCSLSPLLGSRLSYTLQYMDVHHTRSRREDHWDRTEDSQVRAATYIFTIIGDGAFSIGYSDYYVL